MANPFIINTSREDDLSIISIEGFVDAHTAPSFENAIQSEIEKGHHRIIVNCEKLNYISSAGLGVFMSFVEEVREKGGDIKICGLVEKVKSTFVILGFQEIFDIVDNQTAAVQKFSAG